MKAPRQTPEREQNTESFGESLKSVAAPILRTSEEQAHMQHAHPVGARMPLSKL
jgi:hypothetical protein